METPCPSCGATLRVNANLAGSRVSCPQCGAGVEVPAPPREKPRTRTQPAAEAPPRRKHRPYTQWLLGAQVALGLLAVACFIGAFAGRSWSLPAWSFLREAPFLLAGAGVAFLLAIGFAVTRPVLVTLAAALAVLGASAFAYHTDRVVDASRTTALALAMLALWLALQHRRATD